MTKGLIFGLVLAAVVASGALAATPSFAPYSHARSGNLLNKQIIDTPWKVASAYNDDWDAKGRVKYLGGSLKSSAGDIDYSGVVGLVGFGKYSGETYLGTSFVYSTSTYDDRAKNTQILLNIFQKTFFGYSELIYGFFEITLGHSSDEFIGRAAGATIAGSSTKTKSSGLLGAVGVGFGAEMELREFGAFSAYLKYEYAGVNDDYLQKLHQLIFGAQYAYGFNERWRGYVGLEYDRVLSAMANVGGAWLTSADMKYSNLLGEVGVKFLPSGDVNEGFSFDLSFTCQKDKVWGEKRNIYGVAFKADYTF